MRCGRHALEQPGHEMPERSASTSFKRAGPDPERSPIRSDLERPGSYSVPSHPRGENGEWSWSRRGSTRALRTDPEIDGAVVHGIGSQPRGVPGSRRPCHASPIRRHRSRSHLSSPILVPIKHERSETHDAPFEHVSSTNPTAERFAGILDQDVVFHSPSSYIPSRVVTSSQNCWRPCTRSSGCLRTGSA